MPDFPLPVVTPLFIHTFSWFCAGWEARNHIALAVPAATTWPAANRAIYVPMNLPFAYPVRRVYWVNGSTVTTSNLDLGIYNTDGTQIYHTGSTVQSGASLPQYTSTDFVLAPGQYYLALVMDNISAARAYLSITVTTNEGRASGLLQQDTALPLPVTATFAQWATTGLPFCGITKTTTGF